MTFIMAFYKSKSLHNELLITINRVCKEALSRRQGERKSQKLFRLIFDQNMLVTSLVILFLCKPIVMVDLNYMEMNEYLSAELYQINSDLYRLNSMISYLSWKLSTEPETGLSAKVSEFGEFQIEWRNNWCWKLNDIFKNIYSKAESQLDWNFSGKFQKEFRQFYLLCRGPVYNAEQNRLLVDILGKLETVYETSYVCIDNSSCFRGEPDLERIMMKSRNPDVLLWAWTEWRNKVSSPSRVLYPAMVSLLNLGAKNNGYNEIGECWREELEVKDLEVLVENLYSEIESLYLALHAVVRFRLQQYYGKNLISLTEPIPAHLLGNMWAQNWGSLLDIIINVKPEETFTHYLKRKNYTVTDLVKKAEEFYVSLGFKPMTEAFWKYSVLGNEARNGSTCHGTAANMFQPHDFRMILCAEVNEEDFSVIHHEMGHIEYYMQYENQPAIFQDGVNSAFQEAIGDAVMYGVVSPTHLHRLGLVENIDSTNETNLKLLLKQALMKLPQIPFALMLEKWRWNVFKGNIKPKDYNKAWWDLKLQYQGVKPPVSRTEDDFDPSAKFHINDNKPYIRYFLSSILQMQIFESMCKAAIFGEDYKSQSLPLQLHKCDIYGSKTATKNLRKMMALGNSITWKEALKMITGEDSYSVRPLLNYYQPLYEWLLKEIKSHNIPVGWNLGLEN